MQSTDVLFCWIYEPAISAMHTVTFTDDVADLSILLDYLVRFWRSKLKCTAKNPLLRLESSFDWKCWRCLPTALKAGTFVIQAIFRSIAEKSSIYRGGGSEGVHEWVSEGGREGGRERTQIGARAARGGSIPVIPNAHNVPYCSAMSDFTPVEKWERLKRKE